MTKDPTFEEGPVFLIESTVFPHVGKRAVVWTINEDAAKYVFASKLNLPTAYCVISYLGGFEDAKTALKLSSAQIADLHREGYLRL